MQKVEVIRQKEKRSQQSEKNHNEDDSDSHDNIKPDIYDKKGYNDREYVDDDYKNKLSSDKGEQEKTVDINEDEEATVAVEKMDKIK